MEAVALPAKAAARKRDAVLSAKNAVVMAAVTMTIPAVRTDCAYIYYKNEIIYGLVPIKH